MAELIKYETVLTDADWQKKKGLVGKRKKTGVGEALTDLQKTMQKSGFVTLDPARAAVSLDPIVYKKNRETMTSGLAGQGKAIEAKIKICKTKIAAAKITFVGDKKVVDHLTLVERRLTELSRMVAPASPIIAEAGKTADTAFVAAFARSPGVQFFVDQAPEFPARWKAVMDDLATIKSIDSGSDADPDSIVGIHQLWGKAVNSGRSLTTILNLWDQALRTVAPDFAQRQISGSLLAKLRTEAPLVMFAGNEGAQALSKVVNAGVNAQNKQAELDKFVTEFTKQMKAVAVYGKKFVTLVPQLGDPARLIA